MEFSSPIRSNSLSLYANIGNLFCFSCDNFVCICGADSGFLYLSSNFCFNASRVLIVEREEMAARTFSFNFKKQTYSIRVFLASSERVLWMSSITLRKPGKSL